MKDRSHSRICCSLIATVTALGCLTTVLQPPAAFAQTPYYWNGGAGSWDTSSGLWSPSSAGGGSLAWVNSSTSIADIGYLGTGGTTTAPAVINLTTPIVANSLVFGVPSVTPMPLHYYSLNGAGITIGSGASAGVITTNVGTTTGTTTGASGYNFINSNLTVAGGQALELGVQGSFGTATTNVNAYNYFTGTNTFSSLKIDDSLPAPYGSGRNWAYFVGGSTSFPNGTNVTMGRGTGIADVGANSNTYCSAALIRSVTSLAVPSSKNGQTKNRSHRGFGEVHSASSAGTCRREGRRPSEDHWLRRLCGHPGFV